MVFLGKHLQKYAKIPWYRASETIWQANKSPMIWLLNYFTTQIPTVVTWLFWPSKIWTISHFLLSFEYWACTVFGSPLWKIWITDNLKNVHVLMTWIMSLAVFQIQPVQPKWGLLPCEFSPNASWYPDILFHRFYNWRLFSPELPWLHPRSISCCQSAKKEEIQLILTDLEQAKSQSKYAPFIEI